MEALNAYTETLPQFTIRNTLHDAWVAILNYYEGNTTLRQTENPNPQGAEKSQVNIESAVQQASTSLDPPTSASLGLDLTSFEDISALADPWLFFPTGPGGGDRAHVTGNSFEPTPSWSVDDRIASADPWLFRGADRNTTGPIPASAGPQNIGLLHTNGVEQSHICDTQPVC